MSDAHVKTALTHIEAGKANSAIRALARTRNTQKIRIVRDALWASLFMTDAELDAIETHLRNNGYKEPR